MVTLTEHVAFDDDISVYLYTSSYAWSSDTELDITDDVMTSRSKLTLQVSGHHGLQLRLRNHSRKYIDTTSSYYMFKGKRIKIKFNGTYYKFKVSKTPHDVSKDYVDVDCVFHSIDLDGHLAQIRVTPNNDGNIYLEDVLFMALYDTGLYNHFVIKDEDGNVYRPGAEQITKHSISVENEIVYWNNTVLDILNDVTTRAGCIFHYTDVSDSDYASYINIVEITTDYDASTDDIIYLSGDHNMMNINIDIDRHSVVNKVIVDNLGVRLFDEDSIDDYGPSKPLVVSMPDEYDTTQYLNYVNRYLSYSKDPEISVTFGCNYFVDIDDLNKFVKVIDSDEEYDNQIGIDRKYRVSKLVYDLAGNKTTISGGTLARVHMLDKLKELMEKEMGNQDENEIRRLIKGGSVKLQVHTDRSSLSSLTTTDDNFRYGVRANIDYVYESTVSSNSKFYFDDDGVRTGN